MEVRSFDDLWEEDRLQNFPGSPDNGIIKIQALLLTALHLNRDEPLESPASYLPVGPKSIGPWRQIREGVVGIDASLGYLNGTLPEDG